MNYYCIMVRTGAEEAFKQEALAKGADFAVGLNFYFFKRKLHNGGKRRGEVTESPLFPGYVFMSAMDVSPYLFEQVSACKHFYHFLRSNSEITPLSGQDLAYLEKFLTYGEVMGFSRATFDENDRIVIMSGPLAGFKGNIVRVDRRKRRVSVRLDMCENIRKFDLCYEDVSKSQ